MPAKRHVIVYGGAGALGKATVEVFKAKQWMTTSVDRAPNSAAEHSVLVDNSAPFLEQAKKIIDDVKTVVDKEGKADAIFCVAGGWAGGNAASADFLKNCDTMWIQSGQTSLVAARLAALFLKENGLLTLTGASAAKGGTPGMIGYGMVKAAVFHLVSSLSSEGSGLPNGTKVNAILPVTLDTPSNRKFMPNADKSTWTPLDVLTKIFVDWAENPAHSVMTGELVEVITENGQTRFVGTSSS